MPRRHAAAVLLMALAVVAALAAAPSSVGLPHAPATSESSVGTSDVPLEVAIAHGLVTPMANLRHAGASLFPLAVDASSSAPPIADISTSTHLADELPLRRYIDHPRRGRSPPGI